MKDIILQMLCLQSIYYSICSFTIFLIFTIYGFPRNIKYLFNTTSYFEGEAVFLYLFFIHIINSIIIEYICYKEDIKEIRISSLRNEQDE
ncbi:hypothetical protein PFBG_01479 [Plasmodium falciparum 7G8]|uniref:Uncharacterized protein n=1 Tax=Plasmodium falciparum (isolate 7G8) TaxID=57266 RepID=W7F4N2_PLAF8|nr:hypothetical protein PFBG_01479 [Plasmodium falciparum 7G8]